MCVGGSVFCGNFWFRAFLLFCVGFFNRVEGASRSRTYSLLGESDCASAEVFSAEISGLSTCVCVHFAWSGRDGGLRGVDGVECACIWRREEETIKTETSEVIWLMISSKAGIGRSYTRILVPEITGSLC